MCSEHIVKSGIVGSFVKATDKINPMHIHHEMDKIKVSHLHVTEI